MRRKIIAAAIALSAIAGITLPAIAASTAATTAAKPAWTWFRA